MEFGRGSPASVRYGALTMIAQTASHISAPRTGSVLIGTGLSSVRGLCGGASRSMFYCLAVQIAESREIKKYLTLSLGPAGEGILI